MIECGCTLNDPTELSARPALGRVARDALPCRRGSSFSAVPGARS